MDYRSSSATWILRRRQAHHGNPVQPPHRRWCHRRRTVRRPRLRPPLPRARINRQTLRRNSTSLLSNPHFRGFYNLRGRPDRAPLPEQRPSRNSSPMRAQRPQELHAASASAAWRGLQATKLETVVSEFAFPSENRRSSRCAPRRASTLWEEGGKILRKCPKSRRQIARSRSG